ncbi:MAG: glutaredoxin [Alkalispirochaeta sp.]|jgi:arsenate reductase-like glutaredoxin family protein
MTPQIIGTKKSAAFRSCERYCRERGIAFQHRDPLDKPLSDGEIQSVLQAGFQPEDLIDTESAIFSKKGLAWMDYDPLVELRENPGLLKQPVVRTDRGVSLQPDRKELDRLFGR